MDYEETMEEQMKAIEAIRERKYEDLKSRGLIPNGDENYDTIEAKNEE